MGLEELRGLLAIVNDYDDLEYLFSVYGMQHQL